MPFAGVELGRGNSWVPLKAMQCETSAVTVIAHDEQRAFAAGDEQGIVVVWETYETLTNRSSVRAHRAGMLASDATTPSSPKRDQKSESSSTNSNMDYVADDLYAAKPDAIREILRSHVPSSVSALCVLGIIATVFVGTANGALYCCSDWSVTGLNLIPTTGKTGASGSITRITYGTFWYHGSTVPSVYVSFSSGHVHVYSVSSKELLGYCCSPDELYLDVDECCRALYSCFLDANMEMCAVPDPLSVHVVRSDSVSSLGRSSSSGSLNSEDTQSTVSSTQPKASGFAFRGKKDDSSAASPSASAKGTKPARGTWSCPEDQPHFLVVVSNHAMFMYDMRKFAVATRQPTSTSSVFTSVQSGAATSKFLSIAPIVAASTTLLIEEAARAFSDPIACLNCVTSAGDLISASMKHKTVISAEGEPVSILDGVCERPLDLQGGAILSNGDCYLLGSPLVLFSATVSSAEYVHSNLMPSRSSTQTTPPKQQHKLRTGREEKVLAAKKAVAKRRASIITITSAPTDLEKLFSKTMDDRARDDLMGSLVQQQSAPAEAVVATRSAEAVKKQMHELREAFEERDEKLRRMVEKMEGFKESSQQYRIDSAAHIK